MSVTFEQAPLVEIICELKWAQQLVLAHGAGQSVVTPFAQPAGGGSSLEEFFMRFGGAVFQDGYRRAERLVPPGVPMMAHQPVYRYRAEDAATTSSLFQVGPGVFTANAVPPYKSWREFSPTVRRGVQALLDSRVPDEKTAPLSSLSLRYIDAFGEPLLGGRSIGDFISEVLGFKASLPAGFTKRAVEGKSADIFMQFSMPAVGGIDITGAVGKAIVNGATVAMLDITATHQGEHASDVDTVMQTLDSCRDVLHGIFVEITSSIRQLMKPQGADE